MAVNTTLLLCVLTFLVQSVLSQCWNSAGIASPYGVTGRNWGYDGIASPYGIAGRSGYENYGLGCGLSAVDITPTSGGGLIVTSGSAIPPVGVSLASENVYEGVLAAAGELPFIGTVEVEGVTPTAGAGAVNYGCGNGITAMSASDIFAPAIGISAIGGFAPGAAIPASGFGYAGWAGRGCGCGAV